MKYIIQLCYDIKNRKYYGGEFVKDGLTTMSNAVVYDTRKQAQEQADEISDAWFAGVKEVSSKMLFVAGLKGI